MPVFYFSPFYPNDVSGGVGYREAGSQGQRKDRLSSSQTLVQAQEVSGLTS